MKFAFIEFLYYFLREDVERVNKAQKANNKMKYKESNAASNKRTKLEPMQSSLIVAESVARARSE